MRVFLLAALGGLALTAVGAFPLDAQSGRISYDTFSLANGLRVIASEDHSTPIVAVDVWYNAGSRNERAGRSGFAHLFEHMMFQGSAHVKKAEHFQRVQRAGGTDNGSTQEDRTNYFEVLPSNRLNLALWLEADRMRSLAITQENFENQRETVKEERRLRVDNQPYQRAFVDGLTLPYDSTTCFAYAHSVIGDMADLNAAKLPDVQAFFDTYYAPNNATLVVVGDFNPAELRRLVTQYYASIPSHPAPAPVSCEYRLGPGTVRREYADEHANLPAVVRLYRVPPHDDADTPALTLMNIILGQGESSRLNVTIVRRAQAARLEQGIARAAQAAGVTIQQTRVGTMFTTFFSETAPRDWPTVEKADKQRFARFFQNMLSGGIYLAPSQFEAGFISTVHSAAVIDATIEAAEQAMRNL